MLDYCKPNALGMAMLPLTEPLMPVLLPANRSMQDGSVSSPLGLSLRNRYRTGTPQVILDPAHAIPPLDYGELVPKAAPFRIAVRRVNRPGELR